MSEAALLLEARNVAKRFDSVVALKAASLQVRPGEVHGLMGANGAGKSTLVKIITGVFPADGGQIFVKGVARSFRSPAEARSAGIVSVYQDPALVPDLTVSAEHAPRRRLRRRRTQMAGGTGRRQARFQPPGPRPALPDPAPDRSCPCACVGARGAVARRNHGFASCGPLRADLRDGAGTGARGATQ